MGIRSIGSKLGRRSRHGRSRLLHRLTRSLRLARLRRRAAVFGAAPELYIDIRSIDETLDDPRIFAADRKMQPLLNHDFVIEMRGDDLMDRRLFFFGDQAGATHFSAKLFDQGAIIV